MGTERDSGIRLFRTAEHECGYYSDRMARDLVIDPQDPTTHMPGTDLVNALNSASNAQGVGNAFTIDSSGKKVVIAASADIEFADTASQVLLGFSAGTGTAPLLEEPEEGLPQIRAGKLRALAVTSAQRSPAIGRGTVRRRRRAPRRRC